MSSNYEGWLLMAIFTLAVILIVYIQRSANGKKKSVNKASKPATSNPEKMADERTPQEIEEAKAKMAKIRAMRK